ncbi:MAG: GNAT family N-acetyltransferase [Acidobacteria bacterium]|nr:GNAT family N-acetyltransferase [Acidobacteriota bacterium]
MRKAFGKLSSRVVAITDLTAAEVADWDGLCRTDHRLQSPFLSPYYSEAVASVRQGVFVCVLCRSDGQVGFFPFQFRDRAHQLLGAAERVGESMTDLCGVVAAPEFRIEPRELLAAAGLQSFYFTHLGEYQTNHGLGGERPEMALSLKLHGRPLRYWEHLRQVDRKLVTDTERLERQVERDFGPLRFRLAEANCNERLEYLMREKGRQYIRTGSRDIFAVPWKGALLRHLAAFNHPTCSGLLSTLVAGDVWLASHFGLRSGDLLHYWFPVYNYDLKRYSPGRLLMKQLIQCGPDLGIGLIDLGAGESFAKRKLSHGDAAYRVYRGTWHRPGLRSLVYRAARSLRWRLEARAHGEKG